MRDESKEHDALAIDTATEKQLDQLTNPQNIPLKEENEDGEDEENESESEMDVDDDDKAKDEDNENKKKVRIQHKMLKKRCCDVNVLNL